MLRETMDLIRMVIHSTFTHPTEDRAIEVWVSLRPTSCGTHKFMVSCDADPFERFYRPGERLLVMIRRTCRRCVVVCAEHGVVHTPQGSEKIKDFQTYRDRSICSIEAELEVNGTLKTYRSLVGLVESLLPPASVHLEVNSHHVHCRAPVKLIELVVGDEITGASEVSGEIHELPPKLHEDHVVEPLILLQGVPVGPCELKDNQFNITSGLHLGDVQQNLNGVNAALLSAP